MLGQSTVNNSLLLALFAVVTTAAIAATFLGTKDIIAEQERAAQAKALRQIIPSHRHNNSMLDDIFSIDENQQLGSKGTSTGFIARQNGDAVAIIIPATARDGYSGNIHLIIGINKDGSVAGVRALSHAETPGLGDKIDIKKSDWILGFNGKSLHDPKPEKWKVKKDKGVFDQFTGATITPRAVTKSVFQALQFFEANKEQWFSPASDNTKNHTNSNTPTTSKKVIHHG